MIIGKFFKAPADRKRYTVDYSDWLDEDELVSSTTVTTPFDPLGFFVDGAIVNTNGKEIIFYVSGGSVGDVDVVTITIYTDRQQVKEDTVVFTISYEGRNL